MPTILAENRLIGVILDYEKEVDAPLKQGFYLESIARLDAYIDRLLNSLVRQVYGNNCCQSLFNSVEYSMKDNYTFVSGLVRLDILRQTLKLMSAPNPKVKLPSDELHSKIRKFKENRNKALHSDRGHCALVEPQKHETNESFQEEAKTNAINTIQMGRECCNELEELLQDNALILGATVDKFARKV